MRTPLPLESLAPSDLKGRVDDGVPVEVAGRVLAVAGAEMTLADAFAQVRVVLSSASPISPGDLVRVRGVTAGGGLATGSVVERVTPSRPPGRADSEVQRLIGRAVGSRLKARARALRAIRAFFEDRAFLEVETPAMVPSPGLDLHLDAFAVPGAEGPGFVDGTGYLITSPEYQMKRLLAGGVPRCFQIARCFRRGEIGRRHNPEFTLLEWYRAFFGVDDMMAETEALVRHVAQTLGETGTLTVSNEPILMDAPFDRLPVPEAFARFAGVSAEDAIAMAFDDEDRFFRLLVEAVEPALARVQRPVFLCDYPAPFASLARLKESDPRLAERFELYVAGVELCNGFGELTDPVEQRARLLRDQADRRRLSKPVYPIDERFLASLEEGMPWASGNALGVDRLIAVCLGTDAIDDVQAFPVGWL